jgi:hypothetical protein
MLLLLEEDYVKDYLVHRLSINRPTKRGKEKSPSVGHMRIRDGRPFAGVPTNSTPQQFSSFDQTDSDKILNSMRIDLVVSRRYKHSHW